MKVIKFQRLLKLLTDLTFAMVLLAVIALISAIGSVIEQDESISFYEENYKNLKIEKAKEYNLNKITEQKANGEAIRLSRDEKKKTKAL